MGKQAIKIGVVGLGLMGERHVRVYDKMPLVQLYALCDMNEGRARELSETYHTRCFSNLEDMLRDPELDAVDIVLPDNMHRDAIILAARYGKHIMVEKPMANNLADAEAIYQALRGFDKAFMIGQILRFDPRYAMARDCVQAGRLGDIVSVYTRRNSPITGPRHYKGATDLSQHVMVHDIDAIQWVLGERIMTVYAKASDRILREIGMTDCIHCMFTTEKGVLGTMEACWVLPETSPSSIDDQLELIGSDAAVYTKTCGDGFMVVDGARADATDSRHWPDLNGGVSGALYEELTEFVRCIAGESVSMISPADGLYLVRVIDAIERSIREGREITLD